MSQQRIQLRRGLDENLPNSGMLEGEPLVTLDRGNIHIATEATVRKPITPAIEDLASIGTINGAADLLIIHDADGSGQKEKKVTVNDLKEAFNIPPASTDEKVAVVSGATAGYIWGTDGTDGIFRMGSSMKWTKDGGNAFVTLDVDVIDGGTF
jgi:hypothetical protein